MKNERGQWNFIVAGNDRTQTNGINKNEGGNHGLNAFAKSGSIRNIEFWNCKSSLTFVIPVIQGGGKENMEIRTHTLRISGNIRISEISNPSPLF